MSFDNTVIVWSLIALVYSVIMTVHDLRYARKRRCELKRMVMRLRMERVIGRVGGRR